jgi:hypothetical protein
VKKRRRRRTRKSRRRPVEVREGGGVGDREAVRGREGEKNKKNK